MTTIPFTPYDTFAYLSSGSIFVAILDYYIFGTKFLTHDNLTITESVVFLFLAYIIGHVAASASSILFDDLLMRKCLGKPSQILMQCSPDDKCKHKEMKCERHRVCKLFPIYFRPLPEKTKERIAEQKEARGFSGEDEAMFIHAFSVVAQSDVNRGHLDNFRNMYGFARNVSFSLILVSIILPVSAALKAQTWSLWWSIGGFLIGYIMLCRYLKFYRQYTYQLFLAYSELQPSQQESVNKIVKV